MDMAMSNFHDWRKIDEQYKCDSVIIATPIDLNRIIKIKKPIQVYYDFRKSAS